MLLTWNICCLTVGYQECTKKLTFTSCENYLCFCLELSLDLCGLLARGLVSVLLQHFGELRYALYLVKAQSEGGMTFSFTSQRSKCCIRSRRFKFNKLSEKKNMLMMVIAWRLCRKQVILLSLNTNGTKLKLKLPTILSFILTGKKKQQKCTCYSGQMCSEFLYLDQSVLLILQRKPCWESHGTSLRWWSTILT